MAINAFDTICMSNRRTIANAEILINFMGFPFLLKLFILIFFFNKHYIVYRISIKKQHPDFYLSFSDMKLFTRIEYKIDKPDFLYNTFIQYPAYSSASCESAYTLQHHIGYTSHVQYNPDSTYKYHIHRIKRHAVTADSL